MTDGLDVAAHLRAELAKDDPWGLEANPFDRQRLAAMLEMIQPHAPFARALEVGCAGGAFTARLAPLCERLHVIDVMPDALARAAGRVGADGRISWEVRDAADPPAGPFDLIVAAEVLYYLPDAAALARAVDTLSAALAPGGLLLFGSASDEAVGRWGLYGGAETTMSLFEIKLEETGRTRCHGADWGENCFIIGYTRKPAGQGRV